MTFGSSFSIRVRCEASTVPTAFSLASQALPPTPNYPPPYRLGFLFPQAAIALVHEHQRPFHPTPAAAPAGSTVRHVGPGQTLLHHTTHPSRLPRAQRHPRSRIQPGDRPPPCRFPPPCAAGAMEITILPVFAVPQRHEKQSAPTSFGRFLRFPKLLPDPNVGLLVPECPLVAILHAPADHRQSSIRHAFSIPGLHCSYRCRCRRSARSPVSMPYLALVQFLHVQPVGSRG